MIHPKRGGMVAKSSKPATTKPRKKSSHTTIDSQSTTKPTKIHCHKPTTTAKIHHHQTHKPLNPKPTLNMAKPTAWVGKSEELKREWGSAASGGTRLGRGVRLVRSGGRSVSWVGAGEASWVCGGWACADRRWRKREKLRGKMEKKMWGERQLDEMKEKEGKSKGKKIIKIIRVMWTCEYFFFTCYSAQPTITVYYSEEAIILVLAPLKPHYCIWW